VLLTWESLEITWESQPSFTMALLEQFCQYLWFICHAQVYIVHTNGNRFILPCTHADTAEDLKHLFHERYGLPPCQQRLIFVGKQMEDTRPVVDYGVHPDCDVFLVTSLKGC
jgi:ubiquitin C